MIGHQPAGAIPGAIISAVAHEGLTVTVDGRPARRAIFTEDGRIVASGPEVAREAGPYHAIVWRTFGEVRVGCANSVIPLRSVRMIKDSSPILNLSIRRTAAVVASSVLRRFVARTHAVARGIPVHCAQLAFCGALAGTI